MPDLDDELRRRLQSAGRRVPTGGVYERLASRRRRKAVTHRIGSAVLAVGVVAGSSLGLVGLQRAFRGSGEGRTAVSGDGASTTVGFVRAFNGQCDGPGREGGFEIFTVDTVTGEVRKVPFAGHRDRYAGDMEFSPDGTRVAYTNLTNHHLDVTDVATGATRTLVSDLQVVDAPHWSADGSSLLFNDLNDRGDVFTVNVVGANGTGLTRLTEGTMPVWTDQGLIAFAAPTDDGTGYFTMNADGSDIRLRHNARKIVPIDDPEWSPDGNQVAASALSHENRDIFAVDLTLRTPLRLTDDPALDTGPAWSPDGSQIAFTTTRWSPDPRSELFNHVALMNADGSDVRQLTSECWNDYFATWVRDDSVVKMLPAWNPGG
jgi:dipeptidyl aminopeptidase/acylaminoacyl peptidase